MTPEPLLRAPPFPDGQGAVSQMGADTTPAPDAGTIERWFAAIRAARVGGRFWAPAAAIGGHRTVVRLRSAGEAEAIRAKLGESERGSTLWLQSDETDPWSLLDGNLRLVAHGDDEWVAIAHIAGCPVDILSDGRFGAAGADTAQIRARVAGHLAHSRYRDLFTERVADIEATIAQLADWRRMIEANRGIVAACGIAWWKRHEMRRFLWAPGQRLRFFRSERRAIRHAARLGGTIAVWPSRISAGMAEAARRSGVALVRVEDGFVRSAGLGANLVPPSSIAVDRLGIHYDPGAPSDLETILAQADFPPALLARATRLRRVILDAGIGKYGSDAGGDVLPARQPGKRLVLVPGQVEDDMSVRFGGGGLASNLELLRRARALEPDAEIWFRPHPDVNAGHRKGAIRDEDALAHADRVVRGGGMAALLDRIDAVHVLTSLTGFEALLRGRDVTCHGTPFYAGWGLTGDLGLVPDRRGRRLTLDELVAAVLILYPRYLDPVTGLPCPPETLIERMTGGAARNRLDWVTRLRKAQGRLMKAFA